MLAWPRWVAVVALVLVWASSVSTCPVCGSEAARNDAPVGCTRTYLQCHLASLSQAPASFAVDGEERTQGTTQELCLRGPGSGWSVCVDGRDTSGSVRLVPCRGVSLPGRGQFVSRPGCDEMLKCWTMPRRKD